MEEGKSDLSSSHGLLRIRAISEVITDIWIDQKIGLLALLFTFLDPSQVPTESNLQP